MTHTRIAPEHAFPFPMPMTLVGAVVEGRANFLAAAWVSRVHMKPPMMLAALGRHHTNRGIEEHGEFSINVPNVALLAKTDYCGIVSGRKKDKSRLFELFYGALAQAPLIAECPLVMACRLVEKVDLPADTLYIGEVVEAFAAEGALSEGRPDLRRIDPFVLAMPENRYFRIGEPVGRAWSEGKAISG
ncbi:MAG: flavin reductase family protein [Desulfobacterales bacterium]